MNEKKARAIALEYLTKPEFDLIEFLKRSQKQSGVAPHVFFQYIKSAYKYYKSRIKDLIDENKNNGIDINTITVDQLEKNHELDGDTKIKLGLLPVHNMNLEWFQNKYCGLLVFQSNGVTITYNIDDSEVPDNLKYEYQKWFNLNPISQMTDKELMDWETKYKFFINSRPNHSKLLLAKGIEYAEIFLKHCKKYEPKNLAQIDSLERCVTIAKRLMIGDDYGMKFHTSKQPNPRTTKRKETDLSGNAIALIHIFQKEPITLENRNVIAIKYKKPDGKFFSGVYLYNKYMNVPNDVDERLRKFCSDKGINHYKMCLNWLNSKGLSIAKKQAKKEFELLRDRMNKV